MNDCESVQECDKMTESEAIPKLCWPGYDPFHIWIICQFMLILSLDNRKPYQKRSPLMQVLGTKFKLLKEKHNGFKRFLHHLFCLIAACMVQHHFMLEIFLIYGLSPLSDMLTNTFLFILFKLLIVLSVIKVFYLRSGELIRILSN